MYPGSNAGHKRSPIRSDQDVTAPSTLHTAGSASTETLTGYKVANYLERWMQSNAILIGT